MKRHTTTKFKDVEIVYRNGKPIFARANCPQGLKSDYGNVVALERVSDMPEHEKKLLGF